MRRYTLIAEAVMTRPLAQRELALRVHRHDVRRIKLQTPRVRIANDELDVRLAPRRHLGDDHALERVLESGPLLVGRQVVPDVPEAEHATATERSTGLGSRLAKFAS